MILIKFLLLGLFTSLLFPPFFIFPLGFFIFPYFYKKLIELIKKNSILLFFFSGLFYGIGFLSVFLFWIKNPFFLNEETINYAFFSPLLIIFISFIIGLFFILFRFIKNFEYQIFSIPVFLIIFEMLISNLWHGFPWISFALIISNNPIGSFFLYLFGSHATGFILLNLFFIPQYFINKTKAYNISIKNNKIIIPILFIIILIGLSFDERIKVKKIKEINVELFQINNSNYKNISVSSEDRYLEIINLIKNSRSELLIFGENNYPYIIKDLNQIEISNYLKPGQVVVIGATRNERNKYYNSLILIEKNNINVFDKKILVPFGEFIPLRKYFNFMEFIAGSHDFSLGNEDRYMNIKNKLSFIPVICYEIIFFWKLLNSKNYSSNFIINITNDSWFGKFTGPYQHFYLTKMRAAEFNKPLIRVSNNGISGIFDHKGRILTSTKLYIKEKIKFNFEIKNGVNLIKFHKIYNFSIILFFITLIFIFKRKVKDEI